MRRGPAILIPTILTVMIMVMILSLLSACSQVGQTCDADGNCRSVSEEDARTLEPELTEEIRPETPPEEAPAGP
jgi:hypothetical protein